MKNRIKLNRKNTKEVLGGHTCPGNLIHVHWNGYHAAESHLLPEEIPAMEPHALFQWKYATAD